MGIRDFEFYLKSRILILKRHIINVQKPTKRLKIKEDAHFGDAIGEIKSTLFTKIDPGQETLREGKIANLRNCASKINGLFIPNGEIFSFWHQIGRPNIANGFVKGREIRNGKLIPSIGGGICQLSSSLYQLAKQCDFEILERHTHTKVFDGAAFRAGEDANVFWNYVDFRFRPNLDIILKVEITDSELIVCAYCV